jgi:hypothetical protein
MKPMPDSTMPDSAVAGSTETISKPDRRMPEIPDGCGILPVAVNRIASPLRGEHVDAAPREQVYAPEAQEFEEFGEREPDPRTLPVVAGCWRAPWRWRPRRSEWPRSARYR